jgi:hypothetical protein
MSRHRDKFYSDLEKKFPTQFDKTLPLQSIKEYVKQNFPSLKIAKGFTEKQQQKEFFGPFYKENVDIPIYENLVCMQFSGLYPNLWLDFQRQKIEMKKIRNLDIQHFGFWYPTIFDFMFICWSKFRYTNERSIIFEIDQRYF